MKLVDLNLLRSKLIQRYEEHFSDVEIILPEKFKKEVKSIYQDEILYYKYTARITTKAGLDIYMPNQWFYIASYFTDFYNALADYKKAVIGLFSIDRLKLLNNNGLTSVEKNSLAGSSYDANEQTFIEKFVTDYKWWGGGKTVDRGDYFVSPILNMANLVNVSQSYITVLCQYLAEYPELSELLYTQTVEYNEQQKLNVISDDFPIEYRPYITAIHTKPFVLLAGISGTGKSRIVRELARSCDTIDENPWEVQAPSNFCMLPVKPNWHDSTDLLGYVTRISQKAEFIPTEFLHFIIKAWTYPDVPFFLCLDEMNLAPVEQYFAEYLSCIESRKLRDVKIVTDPIFPVVKEQWYIDFIHRIGGEQTEMFLKEGISIPQNLIVMGTVNMDETTFTFSRKVLDRAMTIEMNDVDLYGGLDNTTSQFTINASQLIGNMVEGKDIYSQYKEDCDIILNYLETVNNALNHTPFQIAYRTRNEFLLYVIENLKYQGEHSKQYCMARALDEITSMKILSRIEGDDSKLRTLDGQSLLVHLQKVIKEALVNILDGQVLDAEKKETLNICHKKLKEMERKLQNGYCSFWT